jgi:hypothetical protein
VSETQRPGGQAAPAVVSGIAVLCSIIVVVKASILGFYTSDIWWMVALAAVAVVCGWVAKRLD